MGGLAEPEGGPTDLEGQQSRCGEGQTWLQGLRVTEGSGTCSATAETLPRGVGHLSPRLDLSVSGPGASTPQEDPQARPQGHGHSHACVAAGSRLGLMSGSEISLDLGLPRAVPRFQQDWPPASAEQGWERMGAAFFPPQLAVGDQPRRRQRSGCEGQVRGAGGADARRGRRGRMWCLLPRSRCACFPDIPEALRGGCFPGPGAAGAEEGSHVPVRQTRLRAPGPGSPPGTASMPERLRTEMGPAGRRETSRSHTDCDMPPFCSRQGPGVGCPTGLQMTPELPSGETPCKHTCSRFLGIPCKPSVDPNSRRQSQEGQTPEWVGWWPATRQRGRPRAGLTHSSGPGATSLVLEPSLHPRAARLPFPGQGRSGAGRFPGH